MQAEQRAGSHATSHCHSRRGRACDPHELLEQMSCNGAWRRVVEDDGW